MLTDKHAAAMAKAIEAARTKKRPVREAKGHREPRLDTKGAERDELGMIHVVPLFAYTFRKKSEAEAFAANHINKVHRTPPEVNMYFKYYVLSRDHNANR